MARCGKAIQKISVKLEETVLVCEWQIFMTKHFEHRHGSYNSY